jgi:lipoprotein-releasing system ATP-binding protein
MSNAAVLACDQVCKSYRVGPETLQVLKGVDLQVEPGEMLAIVGSSGSGKTTLLNLLAGLDQATAGQIRIDGTDIQQVSTNQRDLIRNRKMGFVFQFHHLLPEFTALENVLMPAWLGQDHSEETHKRAQELLKQVGLAERMAHKPAELSGGERQRVAIARSLINQPKLVLMDEPTGNLDDDTSEHIQNLIHQLNQSLKISFVIVTHSLDLANTMARRYRLSEGHLSQI